MNDNDRLKRLDLKFKEVQDMHSVLMALGRAASDEDKINIVIQRILSDKLLAKYKLHVRKNYILTGLYSWLTCLIISMYFMGGVAGIYAAANITSIKGSLVCLLVVMPIALGVILLYNSYHSIKLTIEVLKIRKIVGGTQFGKMLESILEETKAKGAQRGE